MRLPKSNSILDVITGRRYRVMMDLDSGTAVREYEDGGQPPPHVEERRLEYMHSRSMQRKLGGY